MASDGPPGSRIAGAKRATKTPSDNRTGAGRASVGVPHCAKAMTGAEGRRIWLGGAIAIIAGACLVTGLSNGERTRTT